MSPEEFFYKMLKEGLENYFDTEIIRLTEYDHNGEIFGRPDEIELDLIIKDDLLIICELGFSMSKGRIYMFDKKVSFYENHHQKKANRKLVIAPLIYPGVVKIGEKLGIEVYNSVEAVKVIH
ncbi:MAG: DUF3782 domain-containing protein [Gomphosphaeria aponina SAG 52.96 = DSM 107014]|uniref:DUF3782 domain-containing protein n=1 Tax=Gomphosphaeria aponina SAG 52.96 = DSM 107014 TaxID=1521640 RepID=A0A941GYI0_9CHRO|nr:DUF3782 domain-containing protein [Gomphosphaeria aponina SAG 52.96 = DSM 107014]